MEIINVIYGIWFIQYSVKYRHDFWCSKIIRIENHTHFCANSIHSHIFRFNRTLVDKNGQKFDTIIDGFKVVD